MQYLVLNPLLRLLLLMPSSLSRILACFLADFVYLFASGRRKVGLANIGKAYGNKLSPREKEKILHASFRNTAMSIADLLTSRKTKQRAREIFRIHGLEHYEEALQKKKGAVLVTSHLGSWEYLAFLFYLTETHCSVIVKEIRNPYFDREVNAARRETGLNPVNKKNSIRVILSKLRQNQTAAVLIDQWAGPEGIWQELFGVETSTTSLPARLAQQTGCALLQAFCIRAKDGTFDIIIKPPVFIEDFEDPSEEVITRRLNQVLEEEILKHPGQWSWAHRRWKEKPSSVRNAVKD